MKQKLIKWICFFLFFLSILFLFFVLNFIRNFPPLLPTKKWQVEAVAFSGKSVTVKTYRAHGYEEPLFIFIDGGRGNPVWSPYYKHYYVNGEMRSEQIIDTATQRWFVIALHDEKNPVTVPNDPRTFPYLTYKPVGNYGVPILSHKMEMDEKWYQHHESDSVVFSNAVISVTVSKKGVP